MSWFTKVRDAVEFKGGTPASPIVKDVQRLSEAPGSLASLTHAISAHSYGQGPYGSTVNSADIFAGGVSSRSRRIRGIGRAVGTAFAAGATKALFSDAASGSSDAPVLPGGPSSLINPVLGGFNQPSPPSSGPLVVLTPRSAPAPQAPSSQGPVTLALLASLAGVAFN